MLTGRRHPMTTGPATTLVWFRDDLRLADNAALEWAAQGG
ncbi:MAG: deoxyribodipyrimidine photo-lyase, partial [Corynebacterium variabile]